MSRMVVAVCVAALLASPVSAGESARSGGPILPATLAGDERDCNQLVPEVSAVGQLGAPAGAQVALDVLVLTERVDLAVTRGLFSKAAQAYAPLGIRLVPRFRVIPPVPDLDGDSEKYLIWLRDQFGGKRPAGSDVVYLATHRYLDTGGLADCIGGVADPRHAFAIGMLEFGGVAGVNVEPGVDEPQGPPVPDSGAKLTAHEIGHLLGAHHHYGGDCTGASDPAHPCDVMLSLSPQSLGLRFGAVNAAVVRDQAVRFARP